MLFGPITIINQINVALQIAILSENIKQALIQANVGGVLH